MDHELRDQMAAAEDEFLELLARGPRRVAWDRLPVQVGDAAPDIELTDSNGDRTQLSATWEEQPAILMFWRHYGCGCGVDRSARLQDERADYEAVGAKVVVIGQGEPERARAYAAEHGIEEIVLCDPEYRAYDAYGVLEGGPAQVVFDAPEEFLRREESAWQSLIESRREGGRPLVDNPWLLPAEFVVGTDGVVRLAYRYQYCEDFPDHRVLTSAVKEARWAVQGS